jgi:hypothetical protein
MIEWLLVGLLVIGVGVALYTIFVWDSWRTDDQ